eukprot:TCONS_00017304-protein
MSTKRPSSIPNSIGDKPLKTTEEFDCERRGLKLTKTCLGAGAYAKVKLAYVTNAKLEKDKRLAGELKLKGTNKVAMKVISRKSAPKEYINKFMPREIETLHATYHDDNIIKLYETFRTDTRVYLVMEYASKGDLLEYINSRSGKTPGIGEAKAKNFFKQLVSGIQHCHRRNVVHRDLKCENLLIDDDEVIKVSDFGFATRFPTNKQKLLETFCGSYAYAAPEILQAEKYDGKIADIWSLGVILFAMLNGRLPYNDRDIRTLIEQTKSKPRFSSRVNVTPECQDLVCKILTTDPQKRATLQDILRHPWMTSDNETAEEKASRGIPDGKSDEIVTDEVGDDEVTKYNLQNKKVINQPYTQRVLQRERWMSKAPEPQAIQKLLHSRTNKLPDKSPASPDDVQQNVESAGSKNTKGSTRKSGKEAEKELSRYWERRTKRSHERPRKELITGILPNQYKPEPVVKKIAFGGSNNNSNSNSRDGNSTNKSPTNQSSSGTNYRLAHNKRQRSNSTAPPPPSNTTVAAILNNKSGDSFMPPQKAGRKECMLPPVNANSSTIKARLNSSSGGKYPHPPFTPEAPNSGKGGRKQTRPNPRQASANPAKQFKTKAIQNFTFNQPGMYPGIQISVKQPFCGVTM